MDIETQPNQNQPTDTASNLPQDQNAQNVPIPTKQSQTQVPSAPDVSNLPPTGRPAPSQPTQAVQAPHVEKASWIKEIAETLAGGPQHKVTINDDGTRTVENIPLTPGQIGMGIVAAALTGAFKGAQQRGPGAGIRAFGAGGEANLDRQNNNAQDQEKQAQQDFARRASVAESNMRMLNNAIQVGRLNREDHDAMVQSYAGQLKDFQDNSPDVIKATGVPESDAKDLNKYSIGDFIRIPDGVVPRLSPDGSQVKINGIPQWDNTYSLVDKNAKTNLVGDNGQAKPWVQDAVKWGLPGYAPALLKASPNVQVSAAAAGRAQHQVVMLNALQSELNTFANSFGTDKSGKPVLAPIDLKSALEKDPTLLNAVQHFQRAAGSSTQPDLQLSVMRQDPNSAQYAGKIVQLFGGDNLENFKQKREATEARNKATATGELPLRQAEAAKNVAEANEANARAKNASNQNTADILSTPDALGFVPSVPGGLKEYNKRQNTFKKNADELSKTEGTYQQFNDILQDINSGKDMTGAQSVVGLFNAIGISATPLKGAGFRINNNTIEEHAEARGLGQSLYQKLLGLKSGDVITPQQLKDYADIALQARQSQYVNLVNQVHNQGLNADFVLPTGNGQKIDPGTAKIFFLLSGNDPNKARQAAGKKGWIF